MISLPAMIQRATRLNPDGTATRYAERTHNWTQVNDRIARLAAALQVFGLAGAHRQDPAMHAAAAVDRARNRAQLGNVRGPRLPRAPRAACHSQSLRALKRSPIRPAPHPS